MTGLLGWVGPLPAGTAAEEIVAMMAESSQARREEAVCFAGDRCGLALVPRATPAHLCEHQGLAAVICGHPWWSDSALNQLASTQGHARALIHAYSAQSTRLLQRLHGTFALALLDPAAERAMLAIDRFGVERLCYTRTADGQLVFATATDALHAHPSVDVTISPQAIFDFVTCDTIYAPRTIFTEVSKLPPARMLVFERGGVNVERYWEMPYEDNGTSDEADLQQNLRDALRSAVGRAVAQEDVTRVGTFLSGGLDSSTVAGCLSAETGEHAQAFTIRFDVDGFDETEFAIAAAEHFGLHHHIATVTASDAVAAVKMLAKAYDEPFIYLSCIAVHACAHLARSHGIEVLLAGDGGDEIFGGNKHYLNYEYYERYRRLQGWLRNSIIEPFSDLFPRNLRLPLVSRAQAFITQAQRPMPDRVLSIAPVLNVGGIPLWSSNLLETVDTNGPFETLRAIYWGASTGTALQRILLLDHQMVLADNDLRKVNRMCELCDVRVRYPILDDDVVSAAARLSDPLLVHDRELRPFFRRAWADFLPDAVLTKPKQGFGPPYHEWMRKYRPLRDLSGDAILSLKERPYFNPATLEHILDHVTDDRNHVAADFAWKLMLLELWIQEHAPGQ